MYRVIGIRFKRVGKIYYFDPLDFNIEVGDRVVVETVRGIEVGTCVIPYRDVPEDKLILPLKPIIRKLTMEDEFTLETMQSKIPEQEAIFKEKVKKHGLEMNLVEVEPSFNNSKITFYFTAEGRVDFRELVKDLAHEFRMRIELRQIGVRDESKVVKGIGPCGREVCCGQWLADFAPVSIKMAKDQNLSLHPVKISGLCNRLMCCLNFEHETYLQISADMPNHYDKVKTEKGVGLVVATDILKEQVTVQYYTGKKEELSDVVEIVKKGQFEIVEVCRRKHHQDNPEVSMKELKALED